MSKCKDPKYRHHKARNLAVVRIEKRDYYLGPYGSDESKAKYHRLLADWRAGLLSRGDNSSRPSDDYYAPPNHDITVVELAAKYWGFAKQYYQEDGKLTQPGINVALRFLRETFGHGRAKIFGPKALKVVRNRMIANNLSRRYVNDSIARIKCCFRWATEEELIPGDVYQALRAVPSLSAGRSDAREIEPVQPVTAETVNATLLHLRRIVADMVQLERFLACRPSEICQTPISAGGKFSE